ncbi:hypothetical protein [Nocardiopsis sp. FIRDI 009]|uniref:hypothetical protein n=1 Tax=Nocardiopsis sp. FIRDI 009 TaxID=714197 RepID=UPI000E27A3E0|nr:hypothetical protein [Nocardiopsis sp. FIRDI 009]
MPHATRQDHAPLPRRVRRSAPLATVRPLPVHPYGRANTTGPDDLSGLTGAVRTLLRHRPDLAHPTPTTGRTPPITDLLISLAEVHRLALTIDADKEAADIVRLVGTLRVTT